MKQQSMRLYHSYMAALEGSKEQLERTGGFAVRTDGKATA